MPDDPNMMPAYTMHEQKVVRALVAIILGRGYGIRIHDGGEYTSKQPLRDEDKILPALGTTGEDRITVYHMEADGVPKPVYAGITFWLIGQGAGDDETALEVVSDHTDNEESEAVWQQLKTELRLR